MGRLTIDLTDEQHKSLKAIAALEGKSIKQFALEKLLPQACGDDEAWEEFKAFMNDRIERALSSEPSPRTFSDIANAGRRKH
ncbi:MAG: antitoxin [Novosphingobium sp.]|nr:antitoxin [Novosphingobium sp.]